MTVRIPHDAVNSEVYIKTPRGHSGIQMDPWMSSTWKRNQTTQYTPNKVTKDKLTKFRKEKTQMHISLHRTAGRQQLKNLRCWSPDQTGDRTFLQTPLSQAVSAEQGQVQKWTQNGKAPQKDIQGDVTSWILV